MIFSRKHTMRENPMLIEFSVANFRSIKERVTLSAVAIRQPRRATREKLKSDDEIGRTFPVKQLGIEVLPVLGIFGPNASGKTSIVSALDALLTFVEYGAGQGNKNLQRFVPFLLDSETEHQPCEFELTVAREQGVYQYSLRVSQERVVAEELAFLPVKGRQYRLVYRCAWDSSKQSYTWHEPSPGVPSRTILNFLQSQWSGQEPFLHNFTGRPTVKSGERTDKLSSEYIGPLVEWISYSLPGDSFSEHTMDLGLMTQFFRKYPATLGYIGQMLRSVDTGISGVKVERARDHSDTDLKFQLLADHDCTAGNKAWPFENESFGTQVMLPLLLKFILSLKTGGAIIVDEFGANIHRNLVHELVRLLQHHDINTQGAQLIFASHEISMLADQFLRRDQIWFTAKRADGSTDLYPLTKFHVRNDLDLYRAYIDGRFGAVPLLPALEDLLPKDWFSQPDNTADEEAVSGVAG